MNTIYNFFSEIAYGVLIHLKVSIVFNAFSSLHELGTCLRFHYNIIHTYIYIYSGINFNRIQTQALTGLQCLMLASQPASFKPFSPIAL